MAKRFSYRLEGLEPDNLLAFLALLGLLRALETAKPEWRPRAFWDVDVQPWRPVLTLVVKVSQDEIGSGAKAGISIWGMELSALVAFVQKVESEEHSGQIRPPEKLLGLTKSTKAVAAAYKSNLSRRQNAWLSSLLTIQFGEKNEDYVANSPLCLPSGQMAFVGSIISLCSNVSDQYLTRSLFQQWTYRDRGDTLRFDPTDARRYALQAEDPSKLGAFSERSANSLAALGLPSLPVFLAPMPRVSTQRTVGRKQFFRWPIWGNAPGTTLISIESLLYAIGHSNAEIPTEFEAERFKLVANGDYFNVSRGKPI